MDAIEPVDVKSLKAAQPKRNRGNHIAQKGRSAPHPPAHSHLSQSITEAIVAIQRMPTPNAGPRLELKYVQLKLKPQLKPKLPLRLKLRPKLKPRSALTLVGRDQPRVDAHAAVM